MTIRPILSAMRKASSGVVLIALQVALTLAILANALVPFYSTKRSGTGLGLALAREIAEAHGGRISLGNRRDGGLVVAMVIPNA